MKKYFKHILILMFCILTTIIPLEVYASGISLNKSSTTLGVGYAENLKYTLDDGLNSSNIVWKSSNTSVATVSSSGKIIAISEGTAIITASINGSSSTCRVTVTSGYTYVSEISLNKTILSLLIGATETLNATISPSNASNKTIAWSSSNTSVATVSSSGKITAKKQGTTTITATSNNGKQATCKVTVIDNIPLKGINLNKDNITIQEKNTESLSVSFNPSNATNKKITWKSSDTSIATVSSSGKVTGIKPGTATITATANDGGFTKTCKVTVEEISKKVTSISLDKKEIKLDAGKEAQLKVTIKPDYAENKNVRWTSSDESIAKVENGKITAISAGNVEIKAISEDGDKEAVCKVTVTAPPLKSISFAETEKTVYVGSSTQLELVKEPTTSALGNVTWTSSNETIATITNGVVNAISIGETTITVTNEKLKLTASALIKVVAKPKEKLKITIEGYDLNFQPDIKNYTLEIKDEDSLKINTNVTKATINGNQNLKNGSIITITIDDDEKVTYVINIKKKKNYTIYFIAAISVLLLINLIRILLKNKKKKY